MQHVFSNLFLPSTSFLTSVSLLQGAVDVAGRRRLDLRTWLKSTTQMIPSLLSLFLLLLSSSLLLSLLLYLLLHLACFLSWLFVSSSLSSISSDSSPNRSQDLRYAESDLDGEEPS